MSVKLRMGGKTSKSTRTAKDVLGLPWVPGVVIAVAAREANEAAAAKGLADWGASVSSSTWNTVPFGIASRALRGGDGTPEEARADSRGALRWRRRDGVSKALQIDARRSGVKLRSRIARRAQLAPKRHSAPKRKDVLASRTGDDVA